MKLEIVYFPFEHIGAVTVLDEFSVSIDSLLDIMVNKTLSTYQRNEVKDVYDLYTYLSEGAEYTLKQLVELVDKKFGVAIELSLLLAKIMELSDNLHALSPLLLKKHENLTQDVQEYFQDVFNEIAKRKIE